MEYLNKTEVMDYLKGYRQDLILKGKDGSTITTIMKYLDGMYTYRPLLQSQWVRKGRGETISCSRCGFQTLIYKNSKYCPNCGRQMFNGKTQEERLNDQK